MEFVPAKSILQRNKSTAWFGTDHTMNLYRGCSHGCIYCDSRSECYRIEDFDRVRGKERSLELLRDELQRKVKPCFIGMGSMSDPYNPAEEREQLTRRALMLVDAFFHGVKITTKSDLITRDIDILTSIKSHSPVICGITVTTMDETLAQQIEPHAPSPQCRIEAIRKLSDVGLYAGVLMMPVLPFLEDTAENVCAVMDAVAEAGGKFFYPGFGMTMRDRQRTYYYKQLGALWPELPARYEARYGTRYNCPSPRARALWQMSKERAAQLGLRIDMQSIVSAAKQSYGDRQLSFF